MTDVVVRLRQWAECDLRAEEMALAAADEIERLRKDVERLTLDGIHTCHDECQRPLCVERREVEYLKRDIESYMTIANAEATEGERLRNVLEHIATMDCYTREGEEQPHVLMARLAAAALNPTGP